MTTATCTVCGSKANACFSYQDFFGQETTLYKCINCGHGFHGNLYSEAQFQDMYKSQYAEDYISVQSESFQQRQIQYQQDVDLLLANEKFESPRVLDFGCSSGLYLQAMPDHWDKSGFEVNPIHLAHLQKNHKQIKVYSELSLIQGKFDLITLRGVIEHLPDHSQLLGFIDKHLAPGGCIYISATPDFSSPCATLYKNQWNQLFCPEHIHQFTPASLSILLARCGLAMRGLHHPYLSTPYADWQKDSRLFLNAFKKSSDLQPQKISKHAFCGNMMSAIFRTLPD